MITNLKRRCDNSGDRISCDETAASVLKTQGNFVNIINSQIEQHKNSAVWFLKWHRENTLKISTM